MADFNAGSVLTAAQLDTAFNTFTIRDVSTTTATLGAADAGGMVNVNNNSGGTVTVPLNSTWAAETGTHVIVFNGGTAGTWTIAATGGVTIPDTSLTLAAGKAASVFKTATNTWRVLPFSAGDADVTVTGTTGSPTVDTSSVPGYTIYTWTGNGSVTTTAGWAEVLVLSGGGAGQTYGGEGGRILTGKQQFTAATHTVTVGAGAVGGTDTGVNQLSGYSELGPVITGRAGAGSNYVLGARGGYPTAGSDYLAGFPSTITGASVTYGKAVEATPDANKGEGSPVAGAGSTGVVILKVRN